GSIREEFSEEKAFSPSSLERYANCPFEFLLRYVLYLDTRDEVDETLTPLEKGNLIHHILFRFYRERKEKKINERNSDEALSRIIEIAEEEIERFHFEGPAWDSFREMMFRKGDDPGFLQKFIESEEGFDLMGLEPRFFELSMGTRIDPANRDPASVDLPVEIDLGDGILKIKGKIDRVDVNDKGQFVVVDYKTGKLPTKKMLEEGRSLQLPLYLKALGSLDGDLAGVGGAYYQVKDTNNISMKYMLGRKNIKECGNDPGFQYEIESSMDHVKEYLKGIRNGRFHTTNEIRKECPSHCAGKDICRYVRTRPLEIRGDE
ncbi:MAG: PD-(D/E)XK nuclease family protein, partial [Candidatus Thermoplasmatota archaeon]|nr:PD-(D/E)XK nuclease family protein [Candidatus Thermoplasmatota archaeon]